MPSYTFTYFNSRGRGELCRLVLAAGGQKFEDVRIEKANWPALKPTLPGLAQLPFLQIDGRRLTQSTAIESFLAHEFGFYGANNWEEAQVNEINGVLADLWTPLPKIFFQPDEAIKEELKKTYFNESLPKFMRVIEDFLLANNNGDGYFVGNKLSLADLKLLAVLDNVDDVEYTSDKGLGKFPKLVALKSRVLADKNIAAHVAQRPVTPI